MNQAANPSRPCTPSDVVLENDPAYVRYDDNSLSRGHVLVIPRRRVASFFDMTTSEKHAVLALLDEAKRDVVVFAVSWHATVGRDRNPIHPFAVGKRFME